MAKKADKSVSTRFQKGQSGNPRGRPRKQAEPSTSAFDIVIDRTLTLTQDGVPREVTVDEALQHRTYQAAIKGERPAQRKIMKMIEAREKALAAQSSRRPRSVERFMEDGDPRNADEAMLILGIADHDESKAFDRRPEDPDHLLLEPWAVKAAISRRAGRKLTGRDLKEAKRCTRDDGTVGWPAPGEQ